ncbi:acetyl-CoA carboxylase biotin carboxylase subunit [Chromobacterium violaceum]|uniref:acetyl-CoA carboxylase biotin carboxylase subunit n=1 Tax=Chromobacterium violaceum TaxID=536 RepID=UPI00143D9845|nr:biotin carboxylase N-terminal domain-containing protein [Chromobacterium violaceum]QIY77870.1 biotin carboxylase [Chromobacterium violaceum]
MIRRLLLCCRGEIALRFIRTCRLMGVETVAAYPAEDDGHPYVLAADQRFPIEAASSGSAMAEVLQVARLARVDAIAPGYGPLAENAEFAAACAEAGFIFVGPRPEAIRQSGDKLRAREAACLAGVPVIPGGHPGDGLEQSLDLAREIGFPVLIKAVMGGGGRGIRVVEAPEAFAGALDEVRSEALSAFGCGDVYLERFLGTAIRHIEVQVLGDKHGNVLHLGDRGCSVQRRRQKLVEEAPAPGLDAALRNELRLAALAIARQLGYDSAGTVEFLVAGDGRFYFIEMNARIQVEHPVTEAITGIDLVEQMIHVAGGGRLSLRQDDIEFRGHAVEFRLCAEDPRNQFFPAAGRVASYAVPEGEGVRLDSGVASGVAQSPRFDSLCAKLIVHQSSRERALARASHALGEFRLFGFPTNVPFHHWLLEQPQFRDGSYDLSLLEDFELPPERLHAVDRRAVFAAALATALAGVAGRRPEGSAAVSGWKLRNDPLLAAGARG